MPNMCHNNMKITGTISEITRFKQTCIRTVSGNKHAQLDFRAIVPLSRGDSVIEHWGTRSNAQDFQVTVDSPGCYEFDFFTACTPPVHVWEKMAKMFPALEFSMCGCEPMMEFAFEGTIQGGKLELWDVPLICTTTDPKTGETISGPPDQIEPLLGKGGVVSVSAGKANEIDGERHREGWLLLAEILEYYARRYRARGDERAASLAHRLAETADHVPVQLMWEFQDLLKVTYPDGQSPAELIGDEMIKSLAYGYSPDNATSFVLEFIRRGTQ